MRLRIEKLAKSYQTSRGEVAALRNVDLRLAVGDFASLQGPSGCGKSTLLLVAGGLLRPNEGRVLLDDHDLYEMSPNARAVFRATHIGFVFQQFHLIPYVSVLENVLAATLGLKASPSQEVRQRALRLLEDLGMTERITHRPGQLSTGERQRTALARALLNRPSVILADEPTGNLDPVNSEIVLRCLTDYCAGGGTVLLATHDAEAAACAKTHLRMQEGRLEDATVAGSSP